MCTYLPGIIITLVVYLSLISELISGQEPPIFKTTVISLYVAVSPLIFGLFIDALRHLFEGLTECLFNRQQSEGDRTNSKWSFFWRHWDHLPKGKLEIYKDRYGRQFLGQIMDIYTIQYHMYEFFCDFAFASSIGWLYLLLSDWPYHRRPLILILLLGLILLSVFFGYFTKKQNEVLIEKYFPKSRKELWDM
jgi:hypothetical protein